MKFYAHKNKEAVRYIEHHFGRHQIKVARKEQARMVNDSGESGVRADPVDVRAKLPHHYNFWIPSAIF